MSIPSTEITDNTITSEQVIPTIQLVWALATTTKAPSSSLGQVESYILWTVRIFHGALPSLKFHSANILLVKIPHFLSCNFIFNSLTSPLYHSWLGEHLTDNIKSCRWLETDRAAVRFSGIPRSEVKNRLRQGLLTYLEALDPVIEIILILMTYMTCSKKPHQHNQDTVKYHPKRDWHNTPNIVIQQGAVTS